MTGEEELLHNAISALITSGEGGTVEEQAELREYPLHIVPARQACRKTIYTTKLDWLRLLGEGTTGLPEDVAILWRSGPLNTAHRAVVRAIVKSIGTPIYFIGDLDPLDLVTYASLATPVESLVPTTNYLGISDPWLERCEVDLASKPGRSIKAACIIMEAEERDGFERLKRIRIDWISLVGQRAFSLLESGMKLELEGASNPHLYSASFRHELLGFIFS